MEKKLNEREKNRIKTKNSYKKFKEKEKSIKKLC